MAEADTALLAARPAPPPKGGRLHVVLCTEGTFPHFRGGVSTWCESLLRGSPEIQFSLWALMMNPFVAPQYQLPENVSRFIGVPLWGIEEPVEYTPDVRAAKVITNARHTTEQRAREAFVPQFVEMLSEISRPTFRADRFARLLYQMHVYFRDHDFRTTLRSASVWEAFTSVMLHTNGDVPVDRADPVLLDSEPIESPERWIDRGEARKGLRTLLRPPQPLPPMNGKGKYLPTLNDATEALRWLYRLLTPLAFPIPESDVVHSSAAAFCGIPGILAKIERATPFLVTEHGVYMREQYLAISRLRYPYYLKKFLVEMVAAVSRTCFRLADQISPVCRYNARWELMNGAGRDRIRVIYNGVDPVVYSPRPVSRPASPTVVVIGRVDPLKDLETALRVADVVRRKVPDVNFLHFGPVADREYERSVLRLWRTLRLERTFRFMGPTDNPPLAINQADVVLLTSMSEAFPYTVIESLMCGKPVVSTDVGGVREALEGTGILARVGDVDRLASGIIDLLGLDPAARQELETACRDVALNRFTLENAVDSYRESYLRLSRSPVHEIPESAEHERAEIDPSGPKHAPPIDEPATVDAGPTDATVEAGLRHPSPDVRLGAVRRIPQTTSRLEAMGLLSEVLTSDPDPRIRKAATTQLTELVATRGAA